MKLSKIDDMDIIPELLKSSLSIIEEVKETTTGKSIYDDFNIFVSQSLHEFEQMKLILNTMHTFQDQ